MKKGLMFVFVFFSIFALSAEISQFQKDTCGEFYVPVSNDAFVKDLIVNDTVMVFSEQINIPANTSEIELGNILILVPRSATPRYLATGIANPYQIKQIHPFYQAFIRIRKNVRFSFERAFNDRYLVQDFMDDTENIIVLCTKKNPAEPI
jgi:hypothetical protein